MLGPSLAHIFRSKPRSKFQQVPTKVWERSLAQVCKKVAIVSVKAIVIKWKTDCFVPIRREFVRVVSELLRTTEGLHIKRIMKIMKKRHKRSTSCEANGYVSIG